MDFDELKCGICQRPYANQPDVLPRLLLEAGVTYCNTCLQTILDENAGQDHFIVEEEPDVEIPRKEHAEEYPKNFTLLKLINKLAAKSAATAAQATE